MTPQAVEYIVWDVWAVSWALAALWAAPTARRPGFRAQCPNLAVTAAGFALLFFLQPGSADASWLRLWRTPPWLAWICVALSVLGFAFCWWARLHLGALWSGTVTVKRDHRVIDSGPYRLVRHPIYTGILAAAAGQTILPGTLSALLGLALLVLGLAMKARLEEGFLKGALGAAEYEAYAAHTPMLLPRLWRRRGARAHNDGR